MGELHLEVLIERLRREYKLEVESKQPKVSYRETITKKAIIKSEYIKQSGGSGHFARIFVQFEPIKTEPNERGKRRLEFVNSIRGEAVPKEFAEAVGAGLEEVITTGLLLGYPTVDVKASLLDGKTHPVDSRKEDFKEAAVLAFRGNNKEEREQRRQELGVVLLEPIMQLEVVVPKDYMGDILANLTSCRTLIESTEEKEGDVYINGKTPLKEMLSYSTVLRQITRGRGTYSIYLSHYQDQKMRKMARWREKN